MSNHKSGKELVAEFEAAVRVCELYRTSSSNRLAFASQRLDRLRKDLIEICDFSVDLEPVADIDQDDKPDALERSLRAITKAVEDHYQVIERRCNKP